MGFQYEKLADPLAYKEGCVPPHSDHRFYRSRAEAERGGSSFRYDLNGLWRFHYAGNYSQAVPGFEQPGYCCRDWAYIRVPSHIQLEGYDAPQYVNTQYPWEGREALLPGQVPARFNPVASYVKYFTPPGSMEGRRSFLVLEGAESAAAVWLNGRYVGYHEDSFTPAEFELTPYLREGENKLAVQVFKWCRGSWCEDQDFFRFSGLYRDVYLYAIPQVHLWDLSIRATPREDLLEAEFTLDAQIYGAGSVTVELVGTEGLLYRETKPAGTQVRFRRVLSSLRLWSAEEPYLYDCRITLRDENGEACEYVEEKVGFRRFELRDGLMCLNGRRILFCGVNRHEFNSLRGRSLTKEDVEQDLRIIKQNNINAIRTSHYPNASWLYRLCDEYGLYLIDETNLESHGTWERAGRPADLAEAVPGDRPEWLGMLLERARSLYERDKNHPSVLIWSCGNESCGGSVIYELARLFREKDGTRLVHYEGICHDRRYPETSDMESQMYTPAAEIERFLRAHPEKPFICCEYAHAMGNSCGGLWKYLELARREPRYQGGFIWDFADQALWRKNRFGQDYLAYGGDFDDRPTDYSFSGNGLVSGDRRLSSKMQEVKFLYQSIGIRVTRDAAEIENRNLFAHTDRWECRVRVARWGELVEERLLYTDVPPQSCRRYPLELRLQTQPGSYTVTVSFHLRRDEVWGEKGYEIAFGQACYEIAAPPREKALPPVEVVKSRCGIGVRGEGFEALFSLLHGGLVSYRWGGRELLDGSPKPNFWRAPTDNDRGNLMACRYGQWKLASLYLSHKQVKGQSLELLRCRLEQRESSAVIHVRYWLPTAPEAFCELAYEVFSDGRVSVTLEYDPVPGLGDMPEFGVIFPLKADLDRIAWYGLGPADTYEDRRCGGRMGLYRSRVQEELAPYLVPQECGNKMQVRHAALTDARGRGLLFEADGPLGFHFSALPYTPHQLELADHLYELPKPVRTIARVAMRQLGVGGDDSWGARTHDEYRLPVDRKLSFTFSFRGI